MSDEPLDPGPSRGQKAAPELEAPPQAPDAEAPREPQATSDGPRARPKAEVRAPKKATRGTRDEAASGRKRRPPEARPQTEHTPQKRPTEPEVDDPFRIRRDYRNE